MSWQTRTAQNYTASAITYTISGNVGVAGATLSYNNNGLQTVTADNSANYSLTIPYNWSGTVTPSLVGYTFSPDHEDYSNVTADQTQNYTATWTPTFTPTASDTPTLTPTASTTPTFTPTASDTPTFTPTASDTPTFTPTASDTPTNTSTPVPGTINGTVFNDVNGNGTQETGETGVYGVAVSLYDSTGTIFIASTTADGNGNYNFSGLTAGTYQLVETMPERVHRHDTEHCKHSHSDGRRGNAREFWACTIHANAD